MLIASAAVPYILAAMPLMWYNHARFGSVFDFGTFYVYHSPNASQQMNLNPMGTLRVFGVALRNMLFNPIAFTAGFPFALNSGTMTFGPEFPQRYNHSLAGLINFPVMWSFAALPLLKERLQTEPKRLVRALGASVLLGLVLGVYAYGAVGMSVRYQMDYMWLFLFPALVWMVWLWERFGGNGSLAKGLCAACLLSAAAALILPSEGAPFSSVTPEAYHALTQLFAPFG
ncbi:MAG: hypothetical protein FWG72_02020 [Oscillospiraceae bacterium]|nr:hypothetical protein [Oscillospiraceae bacterium]